MSDSVPPHRWQPTRLSRPWDSPGKNTGVGCHFLLQCMKVKSEREDAQSYLTFSDPMDCNLPGSSIHGIFQAKVLAWGAIAFSEEYLGKPKVSNIHKTGTLKECEFSEPIAIANTKFSSTPSQTVMKSHQKRSKYLSSYFLVYVYLLAK